MIFIEQFFNQSLLPEIMQALALGLITVTIAIAIFLTEKGSVFAFDKIVILKKVIQGYLFLVFLSFLFVPLFFWDLSGAIVRLVLFVAYAVGIGGIIGFLFRSYKWIQEIETEDKRLHEGYRQKKRLEYLKNMNDDPQRLVAWDYIWQIQNKSIPEERTYIEKFIEIINTFLKDKEKKYEKRALNYLTSFEKFSDNINLRDWDILENTFTALLNWQYKIFCSFEENTKEAKRRYMPIMILLERLIKEFTRKGLSLGNSYILLDDLKIFVSEINISSDQVKYIKQPMAIIAPTFFECVTDAPDSHAIWSNSFPQEWKITIQTIQDKQNPMARLWLHHFIHWAERIIINHYSNEKKKDWNTQLGEISERLFPSVEPITWAIILTFLMRVDRMKDLVEIPRKFGHISRVYVTWGDNESEFLEKMKDERDNAIELALLIFSSAFSREKLQEYINELKQLSYDENSRDNRYRNQIQRIFEDMLSLLDKQEKK